MKASYRYVVEGRGKGLVFAAFYNTPYAPGGQDIDDNVLQYFINGGGFLKYGGVSLKELKKRTRAAIPDEYAQLYAKMKEKDIFNFIKEMGE